MKLWYQSMSRQTEWGGYPAESRAILDKAKDPGTEIHVAAVKMNRIMGGRFTSKRLQYAPPGRDQIDEIRKYYGDVYPTVKSKRKNK